MIPVVVIAPVVSIRVEKSGMSKFIKLIIY